MFIRSGFMKIDVPQTQKSQSDDANCSGSDHVTKPQRNWPNLRTPPLVSVPYNHIRHSGSGSGASTSGSGSGRLILAAFPQHWEGHGSTRAPHSLRRSEARPYLSRRSLPAGAGEERAGNNCTSSRTLAFLTMEVQVEVELSCCKSVGTDLSMRDIEDFISKICRLKKEVASLEVQLRKKEEKEVRSQACQTVDEQSPLWRSSRSQHPELSLTLLCYTDAQDPQTSDVEDEDREQMKTCSVRLEDCSNLDQTVAEENTDIVCRKRRPKLRVIQEEMIDEEEDNDVEEIIMNDDEDYIPSVKRIAMKVQVELELSCCKSIGTDLSMQEIEDLISEVCRLKKEVASLEAQLREKADKEVRSQTGDEQPQDLLWGSSKSQDQELSLTLLDYTYAPDPRTSDVEDEDGGQMKTCFVRLEDCSNLVQTTPDENTDIEQKVGGKLKDKLKDYEEEMTNEDEDYVPSGFCLFSS
ncbi:hypothetical protein DNTS_030248 [Danionella cerebrum]|uniref:Uncharacterized protein n=1 Tax=Danionella cerebrum TaxID=2873325 RepID=A0A553Q8F8_9TELE|nr:hypothetical protein DNTS_030248 [Danionella translucida]